MALPSVTCPECGAEQTSPYGYAPAQTVRCRRCDATFRVPGEKQPGSKRVSAVPASEDEDAPPRSKSWLVVGTVLVLVGLGVMGVARYVEQQRDRAEEEQLAAEMERERAEARAARGNRADPFKKNGPRNAPPPNPLFDFARPPSPAQSKETTAALSERLVGVWRTTAPEPPREVEYKADGSFRDGELSGTWKAVGVRGSKVLALERSAGRSPVRVTFEGDELIHDGAEVGASVVLRR